MQIEIYGSSDDLIEIEGDFTEEFYSYDKGNYLIFSDGTVLEIEYTVAGHWRINLHTLGEYLSVVTKTLPVKDGPNDYSDVAYLTGYCTWIACATDLYNVTS